MSNILMCEGIIKVCWSDLPHHDFKNKMTFISNINLPLKSINTC